jgi:hypothetical protein
LRARTDKTEKERKREREREREKEEGKRKEEEVLLLGDTKIQEIEKNSFISSE